MTTQPPKRNPSPQSRMTKKDKLQIITGPRYRVEFGTRRAQGIGGTYPRTGWWLCHYKSEPDGSTWPPVFVGSNFADAEERLNRRFMVEE